MKSRFRVLVSWGFRFWVSEGNFKTSLTSVHPEIYTFLQASPIILDKSKIQPLGLLSFWGWLQTVYQCSPKHLYVSRGFLVHNPGKSKKSTVQNIMASCFPKQSLFLFKVRLPCLCFGAPLNPSNLQILKFYKLGKTANASPELRRWKATVVKSIREI